jgi:dienelactone hydrolase
VAFYPPCGGGLGAYRGSVPVLLLLGAKDDWARPGPCQAWAEEARQAGQLVTAIVYPGARHAFDARGIQGVVTVPDARGGAGATIAYDPQAHADAEKQVRELLRAQLLR